MSSDLWNAYRAINEKIDDGSTTNEINEKLEYHGQGFKIVEMPIDSDSDSDYQTEQQYNNHFAESETPKPIRSKNEIPTEDILPDQIGAIPDAIPENWQIFPSCKVISNVGKLCICDSLGDPVAPGSLLVDENKQPVTRVIEVFGQVESPKIILHGDYEIGTVFYAPYNDAIVINEAERNKIEKQFKGTDSSNKYDEPNEKFDSDDDDFEEEEELKIGYQR